MTRSKGRVPGQPRRTNMEGMRKFLNIQPVPI